MAKTSVTHDVLSLMNTEWSSSRWRHCSKRFCIF